MTTYENFNIRTARVYCSNCHILHELQISEDDIVYVDPMHNTIIAQMTCKTCGRKIFALVNYYSIDYNQDVYKFRFYRSVDFIHEGMLPYISKLVKDVKCYDLSMIEALHSLLLHFVYERYERVNTTLQRIIHKAVKRHSYAATIAMLSDLRTYLPITIEELYTLFFTNSVCEETIINVCYEYMNDHTSLLDLLNET